MVKLGKGGDQTVRGRAEEEWKNRKEKKMDWRNTRLIEMPVLGPGNQRDIMTRKKRVIAEPIVIVDTREQTPFTFPDMRTERGTLQSGDYSLKGFEEHVAIERKSLADLVGCCTTGRDRFKHELHRLRGFYLSAVIIEASVAQVMGHGYRSRIAPESVLGSCCSWQIRYGVSFIWAGETCASRYCAAMLRNYHRIVFEPVLRLHEEIKEQQTES